MNKETLILLIQELKILKSCLIIADAIGTNEAGIIQQSTEFMALMLKGEEVEKEKELLNEGFTDFCSFLLMEANDNHIEVLRDALNYRYANLANEVNFHDDGTIVESHQELKWLEDIRSLLPPPTIETPSSKDLFEQIRGGKEDG